MTIVFEQEKNLPKEQPKPEEGRIVFTPETAEPEVKENDTDDIPPVKKKRRRLPTIQETEKFILDTVKGQDEQVRSIVTAAYRSIKFDNIKSKVLIIGKSGTGKTEIMRQLAKKLGRVFVTEDANEFTQEGYYGRDVSEIVMDLLQEANNDIEEAQKGIIFIDEIDKKAGCATETRDVSGRDVSEIVMDLLQEANNDIEEAQKGIIFIDEIDKKAGCATETRDVSGRGVLNSLLKLVEGKVMKVPAPLDEWEDGPETYDFDTSKLIIFFAGAFDGIDAIAKKRTHSSTLGFCGNRSNGTKTAKSTLKYTKEDLIEYGFPEEFVGRIDTIVQMNELSESVLVQILETSKASAIKSYEKALKKYKIVLKYDKSLLEDIAKKAASRHTGARELMNVVNYIFDRILYEVMSAKKGQYKECILLDGVVEDNTKFILR